MKDDSDDPFGQRWDLMDQIYDLPYVVLDTHTQSIDCRPLLAGWPGDDIMDVIDLLAEAQVLVSRDGYSISIIREKFTMFLENCRP